MKNKMNGFTLVELLATLVILGIVIGITIITVSNSFKNAKTKTEDVFVKTIEDALSIYIDSDARSLSFSSTPVCALNKTHGYVNVYKATDIVTFDDVVNSSYRPITIDDLVNPANEEVKCDSSVTLNIYRDNDYVYYYKFSKNDFNCLINKDGYITNLPNGDNCN